MSHTHDEDWPYPHPKQPDLEDGPMTEHMIMAEAVAELLIDKGVFSAGEMREMLELIDSKSPAEGAAMVARAWTDPDFKTRMLADVNAAAAEMDIDAGTILSEGKSVAEKGREIYEMFLRVASGEMSKSESQGLGDYEFVPWQIGAVM